VTPPIQNPAPSLSPAALEAFEIDVRLATTVYDGIREDRGLPDASIRLIQSVSDIASNLGRRPRQVRPIADRPNDGRSCPACGVRPW
jgi:hypothetical protein